VQQRQHEQQADEPAKIEDTMSVNPDVVVIVLEEVRSEQRRERDARII
jgi:hypothetical protein